MLLSNKDGKKERCPVDLPLDVSALTSSLSVNEKKEADGTNNIASRSAVGDALIYCLREKGRVDIGRIAETAGVSMPEAISALKGAIYCDPDKWDPKTNHGWETADEYLSGNLRYKLIKARIAYKTYKGTFADNVKALEAILPPEMRSDDIYVTLGSPWLPAEIIDDFVNHLIQPHDYYKCHGTKHDEETGSWEIPNKANYNRYIRNTSTFGTKRIDAVHILEKTLNMKTIRITDEVPSRNTKSGVKRVLNREETAAAQEKQRLIISEFRRWIWKDEARTDKVKKVFENRYGCIVARRFDGGFLDFPGMSDEEHLYSYQKNAVARILFTPNTLLAHDVGAGKTYIMIAAAMELKRLGMAERCMFVVPNNLVEQWRNLFLKLYPGAKLLCIEPKNFDLDHRNQTLRKVINERFDGIIIAYSCFDRIPLSRNHYINELKEEKEKLEKIKKRKKSVTPRFKRRLEKVSEKLAETAVSLDSSKELICFDQLGIERLFVDEAHNYKNVSIDTMINGIYGINRSGSVKCDSMLNKIHHVQKTHGGGGVVMATGTPITNSISDIYVFQKYLQSGELELLGLQTFDSWVGMFAEKTTEFEIAVDTNSYRLATRFTRFHNIPELTTILASVADFYNLDTEAGLPEFGGYTDVLIPRSSALKGYLEEISRRADKVHNHEVSRDEDNMLTITGDGRKAALDIRLVTEEAAIKAESWRDVSIYGLPVGRCKVSECAERVAIIWHRTKGERLTQLVFCDTSTPKTSFNMYDELKHRLVDFGVDPDEIAYIHDAGTEAKRERLFKYIREGKIRILIGSTFKLGLGVNVQDKLVAIHHLDLPWRPADMVQREGRILRAGNTNKKIEIYRYITEGSFDAYSWQLLETKQKFIEDILSGTRSGRSGSEVDDTALNYAEVKALALGNPLLKSRVETRNELTRLTLLHHKSVESRFRLEQRYEELPDLIADKRLELITCTSDAAYVKKADKNPYYNASIREKKRAAEFRKFVREYLSASLYGYVGRTKDAATVEYRGFMITLPAGMDADHPYLYLVREGKYRVDMSDKEIGMLIRIDNYLDKLSERVKEVQRQLDILLQEQREIEMELSTVEEYSDKIDEYTAKLDMIDEELGVRDNK